MPNTKYQNSSKKELEVKARFEKEGWYAIRASGSHGIADVIAIRPVANCVNPAHYEVKFIQVKTSQKFKEIKITAQAEESPCGLINVEYWNFPVKNAKFREMMKKVKAKATKKASSQ